ISIVLFRKKLFFVVFGFFFGLVYFFVIVVVFHLVKIYVGGIVVSLAAVVAIVFHGLNQAFAHFYQVYGIVGSYFNGFNDFILQISIRNDIGIVVAVVVFFNQKFEDFCG